MATKIKSLLVAKTNAPTSVTYSFRVSPDLAARAARVKAAADARGLQWQIGEALADLLAANVSAAERALAAPLDDQSS